jgi:hypothetical protein
VTDERRARASSKVGVFDKGMNERTKLTRTQTLIAFAFGSVSSAMATSSVILCA